MTCGVQSIPSVPKTPSGPLSVISIRMGKILRVVDCGVFAEVLSDNAMHIYHFPRENFPLMGVCEGREFRYIYFISAAGETSVTVDWLGEEEVKPGAENCVPDFGLTDF